MQIEVVLLPAHLLPRHLSGRTVAVFDVLRATSTMAYALAAGVEQIRLFGSVDAVRTAAASAGRAGCLLLGETRCLKPEGFDLGNSPAALGPQHAGATILMSTTNGTRALLAAEGAAHRFAAALVNASAAARAMASLGNDITLLCAGTDGQVAMEDMLGAGAVIDTLRRENDATLASDVTLVCHQLFAGSRHRLGEMLRTAQGGRNVIAAGLEPDIDACARLDVLDAVGYAEPSAAGDPPTIRHWSR